MAVDLTTANKPAVGAVFPAQVVDSPQWRLEPLITPEQLRQRYLFGIPLISGATKEKVTDDLLRDIIQGAVEQAEEQTSLDIMPVQREEKHPWDRNLYQAFGHFNLEHRPCAALQAITVSPPNNDDVFSVPLDWVEVGRLAYGQINIIPLLVAVTSNAGVIPSTTAGAAVFLAIFSDRQWLPSFWKVTYTSGFPNGMLPRIVSELIGTIAAMEVLSMLAATFAHANSVSLGLDAMSQSIGSAGPGRYAQRMTELAEKRKRIVKALKSMYGLNFACSTI